MHLLVPDSPNFEVPTCTHEISIVSSCTYIILLHDEGIVRRIFGCMICVCIGFGFGEDKHRSLFIILVHTIGYRGHRESIAAGFSF